jgi:4-hydroxy-2-oxoheptanedioate aldolase
MGHPGNMTHPDVVNAIEDAFARLAKVNVPSGILSLDLAFSKHCIALGTAFTAVGIDLALLDQGARATKKEFD